MVELHDSIMKKKKKKKKEEEERRKKKKGEEGREESGRTSLSNRQTDHNLSLFIFILVARSQPFIFLKENIF
jgi:hypothetical protein